MWGSRGEVISTYLKHKDRISWLEWGSVVSSAIMVKGRQFSWSCLVSLSRILHAYLWITWFWMVLLVYLAFHLAESRCFCNILSPFANSCSVAMKFPLFVSSTEKSTLSSWWPLKGRACFTKNSTANTTLRRICSLLLAALSPSVSYIHSLTGIAKIP